MPWRIPTLATIRVSRRWGTQASELLGQRNSGALLKESNFFRSIRSGNLRGGVDVSIIPGAATYAPMARTRHALPDSFGSLIEPPLLVGLPKLSLLLRTLSLSVSLSVWNVLPVRSLLAGAALW